jgi:hypothetical protein
MLLIVSACDFSPRLNLTGLEDDVNATSSPFSVYAENVSTGDSLTYFFNGANRGIISNGTTISEDGVHRFIIRSNNANVVDRTIKLDTQPPFLTNITDNGTYDYNTRIFVQDALSDIELIEIVNEDGMVVSKVNNYNLNNLGRNIVRVSDKLGNSFEYIVNIATLKGPIVNSKSDFINGYYVDKEAVELSIVSSFDLVVNEYKYNSQQPTKLEFDKGYWSITFDQEGVYTYNLKDSNNNSNEVKFVIDRTPPSINIDNNRVYVEPVQFYVSELYSMPVTTNVTVNGFRREIDPNNLRFNSNGNYTIEAIDSIGNKSTYYLKINIFTTGDLLILFGIALLMILLAVSGIMIEEKIKNK